MTPLTAGARRCVEFMRDRRFHTAGEIEKECEVTWHSRNAELRAAGYVTERLLNPGGTGRSKFSYRLVQTPLERSLQEEDLTSLEESDGSCPPVTQPSDSSSDAASGEQLTVGAGADSSPRSLDSDTHRGPAAGAYDSAAGQGFIDGACTAPYPHVDECPVADDAAIAADVSAAGLFAELDDDPGDLGWRESIPAESWGAV